MSATAPERIAYTIPEVARLLGIHRRTVERQINSGVLVCSRKLGRPLILAASVHALFDASPIVSPTEMPLSGDAMGRKGALLAARHYPRHR